MKSRVLLILHIPPPVHGSSVVGSQILKSEIINSKLSCDYVNLGTSKKISSIGKLNLFKPFVYLKILLSVCSKIIFNKYDLIYLAPTLKGIGFYKDYLIIFLLKLTSSKIVYHLHNKGASLRKKNLLNKIIYKHAFRDVEIILLSINLYRDIQDLVLKDKIHICPNGIKIIENLKEEIENKENNNITKILFLSNLMKQKGVITLLKSLKILCEKGVKFECNFVGGEADISKNDFLNLLSKFKLSNSVNYLGKKFDEEKHNIFLKSDIFTLPTHNETFGIVNIEAMQYGLPLVSTYEGAIPEIIDDGINGYLVEKQNPTELANAIEKLILNKVMIKQFGRSGRNKFLKKYTSQIFEENLYKIFVKILL